MSRISERRRRRRRRVVGRRASVLAGREVGRASVGLGRRDGLRFESRSLRRVATDAWFGSSIGNNQSKSVNISHC